MRRGYQKIQGHISWRIVSCTTASLLVSISINVGFVVRLFDVARSQDAYGSDLYLQDRVQDVFADNEIFRVIKGASIRASVEPHRARSSSVQPDSFTGNRKRGYTDYALQTIAEKRQRVSEQDPDRPLRSTERDSVQRVIQSPTKPTAQRTEVPDSQNTALNPGANSNINVQVEVSSSNPEHKLMNSPRASESRSNDRRSLNPIATTTSRLQQITSPTSVSSSSKDDATNNGSDLRLHQQRAGSVAKKRLYFNDEANDSNEARSVSTALTTPPSLGNQSNNPSPFVDNRKLKRPVPGTTKTKSEVPKMTRPHPRVDVYEEIETDYDEPIIKPTPRSSLPSVNRTAVPLGVSANKFRLRSSNTPTRDNSSPRPRRNVADELQEVAILERQERLEKEQRLWEEQQAAKLAEQEVERDRLRQVAEHKERRLRAAEARQMAEEEKRRNEAVARANAEREAAEAKANAERQAAEIKAKLEEAETKRLAEEQAKIEAMRDEKQKQLDAIRRQDEEDDLKEQELVRLRQERKHKAQELQASLKESTPRPGGMLSRAVADYESHLTPEADANMRGSSTSSAKNHIVQSNKRSSCTPFIPRGRSSVISPTLNRSSQTPTSSTPNAPAPNVGIEAQMPLPTLKRKVSFADPPSSAGRRSSSVSSSLKQTTLVPPRLGITDVKSTPHGSKPRSARSASASSSAAKGM